MASQPYIEKDELIVKVIAELPGVDGLDVFGALIKVPTPRKADLRKGPNVYWDEDEQSYRATISGRIKMTGGVLDVDEVYAIRGDVGPETGNVKHPGAVVVSGDVVSEFKIEAGGSIEIRGQVYASDISCQGDLNVKYGINSAINKHIHVGGTVKSKHISNAHIICHGDVCADAEICNSNLNVRGEVICRGRIVGGSTISLKGIRTGQAGSETDIKTILVAGVDFELVNAMKEKKEELENLNRELEKNQRVHKQLKMLGDKLFKEQAEQLKEIESSVQKMQERIGSLKGEKNEIYQKMTEGRTARIIIDKKIYARTVLRIFSSTLEVEEAMRGPLVANLDMETNSVVLNPGK
ncbi:MAG: DUF342 domain-containing protein [Candidatus Zixiibacteriota bacterium]|nr:MAG: DUF342 domain-containing protein [candidate division Zixibacteria bacterium]